ncbi:MAG: hypothetical protein CMI36_04915 [Owenweeksia sp.]|nr:hypothetical protein [Owenweeksia sp.]
MKNLGLKIIVAFVLLIPLWSFLAWFLWPMDRLESIILDKSATPESRQEHRSFNWILTHEKMYQPSGKKYDYSRDYYGTYPEGNGMINELDRYELSEMDSMSFYIDMAYYVDASGVEMGIDSLQTGNNWYGGLSQKDYELLKVLYRDHKLIMAEYNTIGAPTSPEVKTQMEQLFEVDFTGWVGKAFTTLDTSVSDAVPQWVRKQYRDYYKKPFAFANKPGIVLAHESGKIIVLEDDAHLDAPMPVINTELEMQKKLGVNNLVKFPNWFDITLSRRKANIYAYYKIHTNEAGDSLMEYFHIPRRFPAVIGDHQEDLRYYFCGDFADNNISNSSAYFKGVELVSRLFYLTREAQREKEFFWRYYRPMMTHIINHPLDRLKVSQEKRKLPVDSGYEKYRLLDTGMVLLPTGGTRLYETEDILDGKADHTDDVSTELVELSKRENKPVPASSGSNISPSRYRVGGRLPLVQWLEMKRNGMEASPADPSGTVNVSRSNNEPAIPVNQRAVQVPDPSAKKWRIIIASLASSERAQEYVNRLGYPELTIIHVDYLNTNRVAYGEYTSLRDAQLQFEKVVQQHPDAWMVHF